MQRTEANAGKESLLQTLETLLEQALQSRMRGVPYATLARLHGYADGYMRALLDAGLADKEELLRLVQRLRRSVQAQAA